MATVAATMISAVLSYGLQQNPIPGGWLDDRERDLEKAWSYRPPTNFQPVYILGVPQSGTTLLYEWLCQYPEIAYFSVGQLSVVDHYFVSEYLSETLGGLNLGVDAPDEGVHEFLAMCNHPLIQGKHGLVAAMDILSGPEAVSLGHHTELSSYIQQLNGRIREQQPAAFLNSYHVHKFQEAVQKSVFTWQRRGRPVNTFLGKIPAASLTPRLFSYLFPTTRFIHIARAPQQVLPAFIQAAQDIQEVPFIAKRPLSERVMASYYGLLTKSLHQEVFSPTATVFHLTYENLLQDPEPWLTRLVDFIGLTGTPDRLEQGCQHLKNLPVPPETLTMQRVEELIATYAPEASAHYQRTQEASRT
ncbi:sulfotransferase [Candidatus Cyanaurora vandensis]|uniref:sulfotransferase n=1 Tax=Candidatus Cyanaurora vandensis TaxID=2714958 RepID=UPI00257C1AB9|nr:sulfotransferase [Candidatus Cyanaurora vandensis]